MSSSAEVVNKFLKKCKSGNIAVIKGEIINVEPDKIPLLLQVDEEIYNRLISVSGDQNMTVDQFLEYYLADHLDKQTDDITDIEKMAGEEADTVEDIEDWSMGSDLPPPTSIEDMVDGHFGDESEDENAVVKHKKKVVRYGLSSITELESILYRIHEKKIGIITINFAFDEEGVIKLLVHYPEDGIKIEESFEFEEDGMDLAFKETVDRLSKWEDLAFGPKLESGTATTANIDVEILEFNKSTGNYKVRLGELEIEVSPENLGKL